MRLPMSKIWRAFPELDRFDDARCRRYVNEAKRAHAMGGCLLILLTMFGLVLWMFSTAISGAIMGRLDNMRPDWVYVTLGLTAYGAPPLGVGLGLLLARDRWLRAAIRDRLNAARCLGCSYSLLGLAPLEGGRVVVCPECGRECELTDEMLEQMRELGALPTP